MTESMGYKFTASANSSDREEAYFPEEGRTFELQSMRAYAFSATAGGLSLTINYGESAIIPGEGRVYLTNKQLKAPGEAEYESGTPVVIDWENTEASDYDIFVLLIGDLKG